MIDLYCCTCQKSTSISGSQIVNGPMGSGNLRSSSPRVVFLISLVGCMSMCRGARE